MMFGWTGKILKVDLTKKEIVVWEPDEALYHEHIGGKGLADHLLSPHITKTWDHPDMPLVFATGPLVATLAPTSGQMVVASRSPLTGTVGDNSVGGEFGTQLKRAGYDAIVFTGQAADWTGLTLENDDVRFHDATDLKTLAVSERLERIPGKGSTALIGPAAENGVLFASIMVDGHYCAGRNGLGLVMAEKRLGYVRISGSESLRLFDLTELKQAREQILRLAAAAPILQGDLGITHFGTAALFDLTHNRRMMPTDNFNKTWFGGAESINAYQYRRRYGYQKTGCAGCHILCKKTGDLGQALPEFETMSHFHALLNNTDMSVVMDANRLCSEFGMDAISAGVTLSCHAELSGRSLKPLEIISLLKDIGRSQGIGSELKLGSYRYALENGQPEASMSVKKMELPPYDPRGAYGMALGYAVSTRGGCHLRAYPISHEILRKPVATDRFTFDGKARIIKIAEDTNTMADSLTACKFIFLAASLEEYARALYGATGMATTGQDLLKIGERINYRDRIMNARNGFSAADDDLPRRFFEAPGTHGDGIHIEPLVRYDFLQARSDYYKIRGLSEDGLPTQQKCEELNLSWD